MRGRVLLLVVSLTFPIAACGRESYDRPAPSALPTPTAPLSTPISSPSLNPPTPTSASAPADPGAVAWRTAQLGAQWGSPVFKDGTVFITGDKVYAIDAASGRTRWSAPVLSPPVKTSPESDGVRVYVADEDSGLFAFDARTGRRIWEASPTAGAEKSQPAVEGGTVYISRAGRGLIAVDAESGKILWTADVPTFGSPRVEQGIAYVGGYDYEEDLGAVSAVDASTGDIRWTTNVGAPVNTKPAVRNGTVYVTSRDHRLHALDTTTGTERWHFQTGRPIDSSPVVSNGTVYFGSDDTTLYAVDADSGKERWQYDLNCHVGYGSPEHLDGVVYMPTGDINAADGSCRPSRMIALDAGTGALRWSGSADETGDITARPAIGGGRVYQTFGGRLYAFFQ